MKRFSFIFLCVLMCSFSLKAQSIVSDEKIREMLDAHSLVLIKDNRLKIYDERGIQPLLVAIETN